MYNYLIKKNKESMILMACINNTNKEKHKINKKISHDMLEKDYPELPNYKLDSSISTFYNRDLLREKPKYKKKVQYYLKYRILIVVLIIGIGIYLNSQIFKVIRIEGSSMEPTLSNNSHQILNLQAYRTDIPQRFDIIALELSKDSGYYYIKRIIGLPGETVRVEHGSIFINEHNLLESISLNTIDISGNKIEVILGEDEYFVLGDNRNDSLDSRDKNFGNIKMDLIVGKICKLKYMAY